MNRMLQRQAGLTLVELMIGMMLGLLLVLGITQVFMASRQTLATNDLMSRMQENGRFALEFMARSARQAGYIAPGSTLNRPNPVEAITCGLGNSTSNPCSSNGAGAASDIVSFSFEPPLIDGDKRDCAGTTVPDDVIIINTFYIAPADANNPQPSLACKSFNRTNNAVITPQQRLIDGVESLQVLYGVDNGSRSDSANEYVSANRVTNWSKVLSVRIAVLVNSIDADNRAAVQRNHYLLDANPFVTNDQLARQIFTTTVQFKNIY